MAPVASLVRSMMLYQIGLMLAMPQAIAGSMAPFPDRAGAASSLIGFTQQTAAAVLGAVVGHTLGRTAWPLVIAVAMMGCVPLVLWTASRYRHRRRILARG